MFTLKKIISLFLLPIPICFILVTISLYAIRKQHRQLGSVCLTGCLLILIITGSAIFSTRFNAPLEQRYPALLTPPPGVHRIVILGAGTLNIPGPANNQLNSSSLARVVEGCRQARYLIRHHQTPLLILSGGEDGHVNIARAMQRTAVELGIPRAMTQLEDRARDTQEEADNLADTLRTEPFLLVSSATHLPRAMQIFKQAGLKPIADPTDYQGQKNRVTVFSITPQAQAIAHFNQAWHEYLGLIWNAL